jgi:hypothetical protein
MQPKILLVEDRAICVQLRRDTEQFGFGRDVSVESDRRRHDADERQVQGDGQQHVSRRGEAKESNRVL